MKIISSAVSSLLIIGLILLSAGGCPVNDGTPRQFTILSYNVQNLFDEIDNGTEYPEFDPGGGKWTDEMVDSKMGAVSRVLLWAYEGGADVVVLQELENVRILKRLNTEYLRRCGYQYAASASDSSGAVVRVALLSRFPIRYVKSHALSSPGGPPLREILEAEIELPGSPLIIFCCHWKSKYGGAEKTETYRRLAASFITRRISDLGAGIGGIEAVVAGDLNENIDEYFKVEENYPTALYPAELEYTGDDVLRVTIDAGYPFTSGEAVLWSPWGKWKGKGSYFYNESWETIDHFLLTPELLLPGGLVFREFRPLSPPFAVDKEGKPLRWISSSKTGFSDHLPILLVLE
jgi:endonuclease/exonuclease/phosphatase family metal-dependent hydrolase